MEPMRRAELLMANMRWTVFVVGAALIGKAPALALAVGLAVAAVAYNIAITCIVRNRTAYARLGRYVRLTSMAVDIAIISAAVAAYRSHQATVHFLYLFVLVSASYTSASAKHVAAATAAVIVANAAAAAYALGLPSLMGPGADDLLIECGILLAGGVAGLVIATGRHYDDRSTFQGSRLQALFQCSLNLTNTRDAHEMARQVLRALVSETGAAGGELLLLDRDAHQLHTEMSIVDSEPARHQADAIRAACTAAGRWVCESGRELLIQPGQKSEETSDQPAIPVAAAPLAWASEGSGTDPLGVLLVWNLPGASFSRDDLELVQALSALASVGIVNLKLYTNLQDAFLRTLQSLAKGLEARDEYTQGHSGRVNQVACTVAEAMGVPAKDIEVLRNAALLHDIGKVGIPDAILRKQGKLTAEEWEIMRKHPITSEDICRPLGLSEEVLFLVLHHHERLDGRGYPGGIPAENQPLLLRILAIADCFDALRSKRPYREPMTRDELVAEFNRSAGRMFDPTVVETLKSLIETGELEHIYHDMDAEAGLLGRDEYMLKVA